MRDKKNETYLTVLAFVLVISIVLGCIFGHAYFEAKAYERVTGKKVSTWDAIFLELRVQGD